MGVELEDAARVDPQTFPDRVPALDRAVEDRDPGLGARQELATDVDQDVGIARIGELVSGVLLHR